MFKNRSRFILITILSIALSADSWAQKVESLAKEAYKAKCDFRCKILSYFSSQSSFQECGRASFFVAFSVSTAGKVSNIRFSNGTSNNMKQFITAALLSDPESQSSPLKAAKKEKTKTFLLPIAYSFPEKCGGNTDTIIIINKEPYLAKPLYKDHFELDDFYSFLHMADFSTRKDDEGPTLLFPNKSNYEPLDCYLLSPVFLKRDR